MLEVKYVAIYDELLDHVMWRPWAKQNNFRQHNGQLGTRVILKIGLASPRNPKFVERNITNDGRSSPRCTIISELDTEAEA